MAERRLPAIPTARPGALLWWLEDDRELTRLLAGRLRDCGWRLMLFHRVEDLRAALAHQEPDLLILDRRLAAADGLDLLLQLRDEHHHFPVLILSAMGTPDQRIEGLASGANDYLVKPFRFPELMWRIERLLQASPARPIQPALGEPAIPIGPLTLHPLQGWLRRTERETVRLSRGDRALLLALLHAPGAVLSRMQLARASGTLVDMSTSRTLDVRLCRLRRRLWRLSEGRVSIEAVRGQGYRLTVLPLAAAASVELEEMEELEELEELSTVRVAIADSANPTSS